MKTRKPRASVFLEAARLIGQCQEEFGCCAIATASLGTDRDQDGRFNEWVVESKQGVEVQYFRSILCQSSKNGGAWYGIPVQGCDDTSGSPKRQTARILGLLLCAQLAKEGFKP